MPFNDKSDRGLERRTPSLRPVMVRRIVALNGIEVTDQLRNIYRELQKFTKLERSRS